MKTALAALAVWMTAATAGADDGQLIGHWKLMGDARDHSGHGHDGRSRSVDLSEPDGAGFDGRDSVVEVAHRQRLQLGSRPFSVALWVHTAQELDDVLGDLVSKYDPESRAGFNLSVMNHAGVTASQPNHRHLHFGIDSGTSGAEWTDHGRLGRAVLIYGMAVYDGQLFAGTCEAGADQAGRVFRYDGQKWTDCGSPDKCNTAASLAVYNGDLYVGVSKYRLRGSALAESENPHPGGKVYRYEGDGQWAHCGTLPEVEAINGMAVYRGRLYASSMYAPAGFFRYEGGTRWTPCGTPEGRRVEALAVYNGGLFATGYDEGAVYRYDGQQWEHLGRLPEASQTYGFAVHRGQLFVSEWPHAKVFRWSGGRSWEVAGRLGDEMEAMPLLVYNGKMYAGTLPSAEVYRYDAERWTKIGRLDFTADVRYRRTWTMAVYRGRLFAGTLPSGHVHSVEIGRNVTSDRALPAGWTHVAAVRDTDHLRLHVDGRLVAQSAPLEPGDFDVSNRQPLQIGFGAQDHFHGRLRDVRLYGRALTPREIEQLAEGGG